MEPDSPPLPGASTVAVVPFIGSNNVPARTPSSAAPGCFRETQKSVTSQHKRGKTKLFSKMPNRTQLITYQSVQGCATPAPCGHEQRLVALGGAFADDGITSSPTASPAARTAVPVPAYKEESLRMVMN